ncbi:hypothetical protein HPB50_023702 [Hyalomma asiaticum]|uniref:Uncharacterized protein n=1 Tax=Hyalomma asiaticum TaxID=266040 RepID=A0ACB7T470_HYAAI|nr:hypothetical protein HPB50_023702 [Hyalomma asiaticum]
MNSLRVMVACAAHFALLISFSYSLTMAMKIRHARDPTGVAFLPLAANMVDLMAWLLCAYDAGAVGGMWVQSIGLATMAVNATVHRLYASLTGPGLALLAGLIGMVVASSRMTTAQLLNTATLCAMVRDLAPLVRVLEYPLPDIAAWALVVSTLRTLCGVVDGDVPEIVRNLAGVTVAAAEVYVGWT